MNQMNQTVPVQITLNLPMEQLLQLLTAQQPAPASPAAPAATCTPAPTAAPVPLPSAPVQPSTMAQAPSPTPVPAQLVIPAQPVIPAQTAPQTYTVEQLGLAARPLMEGGRQQELIALLTEFGVQSVAAIPEIRRADFAARLRALGGQI